MTTTQKGDIALHKVIVRAIEKGIAVSKPISDESRYDLIFDDGVSLTRVQVKYCAFSKVEGAYTVYLKKHTGGFVRRAYNYTENCFDLLLVYIEPEDRFVALPSKYWMDKANLTLRSTLPANNQRAGILMIEDFVW